MADASRGRRAVLRCHRLDEMLAGTDPCRFNRIVQGIRTERPENRNALEERCQCLLDAVAEVEMLTFRRFVPGAAGIP